MNKHYYVYKLTHQDTGEYYIGSRGSKLYPSLDSYMGSMKSWKPNKSKLVKEIIQLDFENHNDAIKYERTEILKYINDPLNKNAHIPGVGFHTDGLGVYRHIKTDKVYRIDKNDDILKSGDYVQFWKGRIHTDQSKKKMSASAKNRTISVENEKIRRLGISKNNKKPKSNIHIENIRLSKLGNKNPMYGITGSNHPKSKPIKQFDKFGSFIKEWENGKIAADNLNISYGALNGCLNGKSKISSGFIWKFK